MATLIELCDAGILTPIGGGLDAHEQPERLIYAFQDVIDWLENTLPSIEPDFHEGKQDPIEQLDDLFHDFISGADFAYYEKSHSMLPTDPGIWELKTPDLRLFGWFASRNVFVIGHINSAFLCKLHNLYPGYRNSVEYKRDHLDLDEPKFITGVYEDVL
jgi:hypothetical protein